VEKLENSRGKKAQDDLPQKEQQASVPAQNMPQQLMYASSSDRESVIQPLNLNFGGNQQSTLPRWAQSIAGSNDVSGFGPAAQNESADHDEEHQVMEDFFEQNLGKLQEKQEEEKGSSNQHNNMGKYKIDLLDCNDEEQEDLNIHNDDDDEVKEVKKNAKQNNFVSMFGLEGESNSMISNLRKSRARVGSKASGGVRSSIAGKFLMKKDTESQRSDIAQTVL
jgi:hypothetical protein